MEEEGDEVIEGRSRCDGVMVIGRGVGKCMK